MDVRIEERDEAGNLMATYAGSAEKGGSGGRWDVIVCRPFYNFYLEWSRAVGTLCTPLCFWVDRVQRSFRFAAWWSWAKCIRSIEILSGSSQDLFDISNSLLGIQYPEKVGSLWTRVLGVFLPAGYPHSVTEDYMKFKTRHCH